MGDTAELGSAGFLAQVGRAVSLSKGERRKGIRALATLLQKTIVGNVHFYSNG
jgi:hypothetical protein